jgi:hypothetical protein
MNLMCATFNVIAVNGELATPGKVGPRNLRNRLRLRLLRHNFSCLPPPLSAIAPVIKQVNHAAAA